MRQLTLGSLFSGSGGFELAGVLHSVRPVWASEIEPFPIRVTTLRFPEMKHLGDVTQISGADIEPVDIVTFGSPCFPAGTLVLTEAGYLPIEDVKTGMKVLTHMGRWRTVTATGSKTGETVIVKGNHYGLECTPNHPIYSSGEKRCYPQLGSGKRGNHLILTNEKKWIPASEMDGRLWAVPNTVEPLPVPPERVHAHHLKPLPPFSDDLFYFVGRWLGDGWVYDSQRPGRPDGQTWGKINLCDSEDKEDELHSIVGKISRRYGVYRSHGVVRLSFTSHVLADWLTDHFGRYAHGKTMPGWVFGLPSSYRLALLNGLIDSDGYRLSENRNAWRICTVSKKLAESIRLLAETLGYSTTVFCQKTEREKRIEGRLIRQRDWYAVVITASATKPHLSDSLHGWYRVRGVQPTNCTKVVYNMTVEEDNSYVADGIVVHNCQDLSIAGNRDGIHRGERSSLFFEAIRIIREMRHATNNQYPRFAVWENVKGAFSSNRGADFQSVLQSFCDLVGAGHTVPLPPKGKWAHAGCIVGDGFSVAWRLYNAEHWGVPQRRERVFLIADLGSGRAGEILFEPESSPWHPYQRGTQGQGTAAGDEGSTGRSGRSGDEVKLCVGATDAHAAITDGKHSSTLLARAGQGGGNVPMVFTVYDARGNGTGKITPTLTGDHNNRVTDYTAICIGNGQLNQKQGDVVGALNCMHDQQAVVTPGKPPRKYTVRRLTPTECGRLQGFPDGWCDGAGGSDTAQYQLWGNGVALPCVSDVIGKIAKAMRE